MKPNRLPSGVLSLLLILSAPIADAGEPAPAPASGSDFDFDLGQTTPKTTPAQTAAELERTRNIERKVHLRRNLLIAHQAFGIATLGVLAATLVVGTLNYVDKFGGGNDDGRYYNAHLYLASSASVTFATTGILALAAPNPYPKPIRFDTALLHKVMMAGATVCFAANLVLGSISGSRDGKLDQRDLALSHLGIGFGAFAFMTAGTLAYVFK
jgi:hypothetical protein